MRPYPRNLSDLASWASTHGISQQEARARFVQYCILWAVSQTPLLQDALVLKGGIALDFVWNPNRSTRDVDFSIDHHPLAGELTEDTLRQEFAKGLDWASQHFGLLMRVTSLRRNPPGEQHTFATFAMKVGYAFPDQPVALLRLRQRGDVSTVIPIDISLNEVICGQTLVDLDTPQPLKICTLEDVVAEKLRALLQQEIRNRSRRQDLLDIAVLLRAGVSLDAPRIAAYLLEKAAARDVPVSRTAFHSDQLLERARRDYVLLSDTSRNAFVEFAEAVSLLHEFVEHLPIPATHSCDT